MLRKEKRVNTVKNYKKLTLLAGMSLLVGAVFLPQANVAAEGESWGPQDRPTYSWNAPSDHRTFNSITDNPQIGDERNFVRIKEAGTSGPHLDSVDVTGGKEYEVYVYFHNNASASLNEAGKGIANNVRLSTAMPEKIESGKVGIVKGTISSTNSEPTSVWDTAYLNAKETVYMRYVWDSATVHNTGKLNGSVLDAEALFSDTGAKLGYNEWGIVPGCNEYAGYVTYRVKADVAGFGVNKEVSAENANNFADNIVTAPGATLDFKITYANSGTTEQKSVTLYDTLPEGLTFVPGSVKVTRADGSVTELSDKLFSDGVVIGDFAGGEMATVTYKARVADDQGVFPCGETTTYNDSRTATANGTITDKARIIVKRDCGGTPGSIPDTGPGEIILASVVVIAVAGGITYYVRTKKALHHTTGKIFKK